VATEPERRTDVQIRREIASEREQLVSALGDLRAAVEGKRKMMMAGAGAVGTAAAAGVVLKLARRIRGG
jgi:hypothetical protein